MIKLLFNRFDSAGTRNKQESQCDFAIQDDPHRPRWHKRPKVVKNNKFRNLNASVFNF